MTASSKSHPSLGQARRGCTPVHLNAAVISITQCLAAEWRSADVTTIAVSLGDSRTSALQTTVDRGERDVSTLERNVARGTHGRTDQGSTRRGVPRKPRRGRHHGCERSGRLWLLSRLVLLENDLVSWVFSVPVAAVVQTIAGHAAVSLKTLACSKPSAARTKCSPVSCRVCSLSTWARRSLRTCDSVTRWNVG